MMRRVLSALAAATFAASSLAACSTAPASGSSSPTVDVDRLQATFNALQLLAVGYALLPRCESEGAPKLCSRTAIVDQMGELATAAQIALTAARNSKDASTLVTAVNALDALKRIVELYNTSRSA